MFSGSDMLSGPVPEVFLLSKECQQAFALLKLAPCSLLDNKTSRHDSQGSLPLALIRNSYYELMRCVISFLIKMEYGGL